MCVCAHTRHLVKSIKHVEWGAAGHTRTNTRPHRSRHVSVARANDFEDTMLELRRLIVLVALDVTAASCATGQTISI